MQFSDLTPQQQSTLEPYRHGESIDALTPMGYGCVIATLEDMTMTTKQLTRITMILRDTHEAGGLTFQGAEITPTNPYDRVHALNMAAGEVPLEILDDCLTLKSEWGSDDDYSEHNFVAIVGPDAELLANWEVQ